MQVKAAEYFCPAHLHLYSMPEERKYHSAFLLGHIFGIPVLLHYTFLIIIPLLTLLIGMDITLTVQLVEQVFSLQIDDTLISSAGTSYLLGFVISLGLFTGVFLHELSHSLVARKAGIRIESITLLFFGGIASIENREPDPWQEMKMAAAGPFMSLLLAGVSAGMVYASTLLMISAQLAGIFEYIFGYLAILNLLLCAFNLLPAFPMDGGRILRGFLATRMPLIRATVIASSIGRGFAILFGIIGVFTLQPLLILIAFFIYVGAGQEANAQRYDLLLKDVSVGDIMSSPVITVTPRISLPEVKGLMYQTKHLGFPVVEKGEMIGIITLADISRIHSIDRDAMQVQDAMSRDVFTLPMQAPVIEALQIMMTHDIGRIPILEEGIIQGIISKTDIFKVLELRQT
jgi:Zn-dependent protease/predicted transcriptional regulator